MRIPVYCHEKRLPHTCLLAASLFLDAKASARILMEHSDQYIST